MKRIIRNIMVTIGLVSAMLLPVMTPVVVNAAPADDACAGLRLANPNANCNPGTAESDFGGIIDTIIDILSVIVGAAAVIMIIIGGFRYVISNGDANGVSGAKNAILYAIVGLVIVVFAQTIVKFVLSRL